MAFDLNSYITGNFQVANDIESIRAAAQEIAAHPEFWGAVGQMSPLEWANKTLGYIAEYDKAIQKASTGASYEIIRDGKPVTWEEVAQDNLEDAFKWITGAAQPSRRSGIVSKYNEAIEDIKERLANEASNIANVLDIPEDASPEERAALEAAAAEKQTALDELFSLATSFGINPEEATQLVRTESGYIPASEAATQTRDSGETRVGEPIVGQEQEDGTWDVVGTRTGTVYESGLANGTEADKAINLLGTGGTADAVGAFSPSAGGTYLDGPTFTALQGKLSESDLVRDGERVYLKPGLTIEAVQARATAPAPTGSSFVADPAPPTGPTSSILDGAGINYNGLTESEIKAAEEAYLASQNSSTLQDKIFNMQAITDEDVQYFLETAAKEQDPYYSQIFGRAAEDFTRSLDFLAQEREAQIAREKLDAAVALETQQEQAAEAGLATSGIRGKAEQRLADQAQDIAMSSRRKFEYDTTNYGRGVEDYIGSERVSALKLPEIGGASIYDPAGGIKGSLEREQATNIQTRAGELEADEIARRQEVLATEGGVTTL